MIYVAVSHQLPGANGHPKGLERFKGLYYILNAYWRPMGVGAGNM